MSLGSQRAFAGSPSITASGRQRVPRRAGGPSHRTRRRCDARRGDGRAARASRRPHRCTRRTAPAPDHPEDVPRVRQPPSAAPASPMARRAQAGRRRQAAHPLPPLREIPRSDRPVLRTSCSVHAPRAEPSAARSVAAVEHRIPRYSRRFRVPAALCGARHKVHPSAGVRYRTHVPFPPIPRRCRRARAR